MTDNEQIHKIRHSLAHLLAMAVLKKDPQAKLTIGPVIDNGFYYDFDLSPNIVINEKILRELEKDIKRLIKQKIDFTKKEIDIKEAQEIFKDNQYKLELTEEIAGKGENISIYQSGDFTDLCAGPHIENTNEINPDSFKLTKIAGAYWRGSEKNKMLTRIYGLAFETGEKLEEYLKQQEEAEKRDHRKLGKDLELFTFSDLIGKGLPLWTPKGSIIRRELERFIVDEEIKRGYLHVYTPDIAKIDLYKKSGHYPHYKDSMYAPIVIDDEEFMLRPMTCPHHFELYSSKPRSYKELPMRIAELAKLYRYEQSGELSGLVRVRSFCLADAHIICAHEEQAISEIGKALDLIEYVSSKFGLKMGENYRYRLSLGDRNNTEKYYKNDEAWEKGEDLLRNFLKERNTDFMEAKDEAAFYGPKIDIQMKSVTGKEDTAFTVQYDFCMPERFDLKYVDKDNQEKMVIVVHRSSIGAIERIIAFLIEYYAGNFPLWLSPVQVKILPISETHKNYAKEIFEELKKNNIRVELDESNETLGKKIRNGKMEKIPYILVIGDKEIESKTVTAESRDEGNLGQFTVDKLVERLAEEVKNKTIKNQK